MALLDCVRAGCPYCGEAIELVVDLRVAEQQYTEDCQVCCQPMLVEVVPDSSGGVMVTVRREQD